MSEEKEIQASEAEKVETVEVVEETVEVKAEVEENVEVQQLFSDIFIIHAEIFFATLASKASGII